MSQISTTVSLPIGIQTLNGKPATGVVIGQLSYEIRLDGALQAITPTLTERVTVGDFRTYTLAFTAPATAGLLSVFVRPSRNFFTDWTTWEDWNTTYTIDSLASLVATPVVSVVYAGAPTSDIALRLVKDDYAPLTFTVRDQSGNAIDLSGYDTPTFAVLDRAQAAARYTQTASISMSAAGLVTIEIPETAAFYALLTPAGTDSITLYFTFKANQAATAAKTRTLARGTLTVLRTETA